ncbi:nucleolar protein 12 [Elaeis guineensis]|uniref:RNA-binding protein 34 n=1 Tax=Elaeis guineensis var. tenera TaxID=51953 RepID=A0A6I9RXE4_ELAGV|nr:RNA-binding protein 34 [Elaeis guineensis]
MAKKSKDSSQKSSDTVKSLFAADNPFRRKVQPASPTAPPPQQLGLGWDTATGEDENPSHGRADAGEERKRKRESAEAPNPSSASVSIPKKRKKLEDDDEEGSAKKKRKKRKRDEIEEEYEKRTYGVAEKMSEDEGEKDGVVAVGEKRKADDISSEMVISKESFDDESKLVRTVFVGNLPVKTKRKTLLKEFERFGEIESVRIRSVPIVDSKAPRKAAIFKGKINDAGDSVHAYIVFKDEPSANAAVSHNMAEIGGNHIRVDMACPPRKKLRGEGPLYDRKRTVFVGNLPFDVKDEELYQLFCGVSPSEYTVEAVRVIRDPHTSLGKGIAYVLFKTRHAANTVVKKRDLKIRDRVLRVSHAKSSDATPSKRKDPGTKMDFPQKKLSVSAGEKSLSEDSKPKLKAAALSYQGLRSSKSGVVKKSRSSLRTSHGNKETKSAVWTDQKVRKVKRPAVAARKAKQLTKKRKQESATPENTHQNKKARRN